VVVLNLRKAFLTSGSLGGECSGARGEDETVRSKLFIAHFELSNYQLDLLVTPSQSLYAQIGVLPEIMIPLGIHFFSRNPLSFYQESTILQFTVQ
jgi:hypothetical protein